MSRPSPRQAAAAALVMLALVAGLIGTGSAAAPGVRALAAEHLPGLARSLAGAAPVRTFLPLLDGGSNLSTARDGRLTVLLLGADGHSSMVGRTDTIIIASAGNKSISMAGIPRDVAQVPLPGGGVYSGRINAMVRTFSRTSTPTEAIERFRKVVEFLLGIEIDHYVMVDFAGFDRLVEEIEPIRVDITRAVRDPGYHDDPKKPTGVYFPAADDYEIFAWQPDSDPPLCNGLWRTVSGTIGERHWCRRAMPFVRSRKGTGNSDFERNRRAQDLIAGALKQVVARGSADELTSLRNSIGSQAEQGRLYTDLEINASTALELFWRADGAQVDYQVVFGTPRYASRVSDSSSFILNLAAVRQAVKEHFPPVDDIPMPTPSPTPTPTATPTPMPSPTPTATPVPTPSPPPTVPPPTAAPVTPPPDGPDGEEVFDPMPLAWLTAALAVAFIVAAAGFALRRRRG